MVVTLGQHYNTGEKPTVILYTYINRHAGTPDKKKKKKKKTFLVRNTGFYGDKILYKNLDLTQDSFNKILFHFLWEQNVV